MRLVYSLAQGKFQSRGLGEQYYVDRISDLAVERVSSVMKAARGSAAHAHWKSLGATPVATANRAIPTSQRRLSYQPSVRGLKVPFTAGFNDFARHQGELGKYLLQDRNRCGQYVSVIKQMTMT